MWVMFTETRCQKFVLTAFYEGQLRVRRSVVE
jgi:hypothetical protein